MINRRKLLTGISIIAAPAVVRYASIMPVRAFQLVEAPKVFRISPGIYWYDETAGVLRSVTSSPQLLVH